MDEAQPKSTRFLTRIWLPALALGPCLLALCGTSAIPVSRGIEDTKSLSPLAFRQYSVNLHEVAPTAELTAPFAFWNRSQKTIEITKLDPSCGCLAPRLLGNRDVYGPGEQGLFEVRVETAREAPGPHSYSIRVEYEVDGETYEEQVTFRCEIPERIVTVTPPELYFYQLSGKPITSQLHVEDHRGVELQVLDVTANTPDLNLAVGPRKIQSGHAVTPIQIEVPGEITPGSQTAFITIQTNDPEFSQIRVPVFLQGKPDGVQLTSGVQPAPADTPQPKRESAAQTGSQSQ